MAEIKVEGLSELRAGLKQLDAKMPRELNKVAKASAEVVRDEAKRIVPRLSGRLQNSIKASGLAKGAFVRSGGLEYHRVIHFGWARHGISPQPFLYDARDNREAEVMEKFEREVAALVDKVV
jgi:HK97 gp10 family phage protein